MGCCEYKPSALLYTNSFGFSFGAFIRPTLIRDTVNKTMAIKAQREQNENRENVKFSISLARHHTEVSHVNGMYIYR